MQLQKSQTRKWRWEQSLLPQCHWARHRTPCITSKVRQCVPVWKCSRLSQCPFFSINKSFLCSILRLSSKRFREAVSVCEESDQKTQQPSGLLLLLWGVCVGTMDLFFPFPGKQEERKRSKHQAGSMSDIFGTWLIRYCNNVTIMNSASRLQGFCVDRGPGCVCLGEIGLDRSMRSVFNLGYQNRNEVSLWLPPFRSNVITSQHLRHLDFYSVRSPPSTVKHIMVWMKKKKNAETTMSILVSD